MLKPVSLDTVHTHTHTHPHTHPQAFLKNIFLKLKEKIKTHAVVLGCYT